MPYYLPYSLKLSLQLKTKANQDTPNWLYYPNGSTLVHWRLAVYPLKISALGWAPPFKVTFISQRPQKCLQFQKGVIIILECEESRGALVSGAEMETPLVCLKASSKRWTLHESLYPSQKYPSLNPPGALFKMPSQNINSLNKHFLSLWTLSALPEAVGKQNYVGQTGS